MLEKIFSFNSYNETHNLIKILGIKLKFPKASAKKNLRQQPFYQYAKNNVDITTLPPAEGQIRGIEGMVEQDAYCPDILIQVSAVSAALSAFSGMLLKKHIESCVRSDMESGKEGAAEELSLLIAKLLK